jgi:hypothetical protein
VNGKSLVAFRQRTVTVSAVLSFQSGMLESLDGGALFTSLLNIGLGDVTTGQDSTGSVVVDGANPSITLGGFTAAGAAAGGTIGRDGGTGTLALRNDASLAIGAPGATSADGHAPAPGRRPALTGALTSLAPDR